MIDRRLIFHELAALLLGPFCFCCAIAAARHAQVSCALAVVSFATDAPCRLGLTVALPVSLQGAFSLKEGFFTT